MTDARTFRAETRLLFRVALAIFTVTVLIGILNGFHFVELSRAMLLTHVHAGTLGWITLVATGAAFWLYADGGSALKRHARGVAIGRSAATSCSLRCRPSSGDSAAPTISAGPDASRCCCYSSAVCYWPLASSSTSSHCWARSSRSI